MLPQRDRRVNNGLGHALRDYDPMESIRWVQWVMLRSATILKSRADLEKEKASVEAAKSKAEKDLEAALAREKERDTELQCLRDREVGLSADLDSAKKGLSEEKSRADKVEASLAETEQARQELIMLAKDSVKATEDNLKEQILVLAPEFDVSLLGAWKEVVDGQIVDPPPEE
ncbi:hypothetical protein PIB30_061512 [Stylosanthes scabra]|uniref:Uncharacterized protein n=1 Tax=Stylosanthes scabra TaxID=79078 RepID=A0ABU6UKS0_9FABA|nr:hypothetical protein [Stylosanthes scabra]